MSNVVILRGYPASGKSTLAAEYVESGYIRINRDSIRTSMFGAKNKTVLSNDKERLINNIEKKTARSAILDGHNIVIDNTNLRLKYVKEWAQYAVDLGADYTVIDMNVSVKECLRRNSLRLDSVPPEVIVNLGKRFPLPLPPVILEGSQKSLRPVWEPYQVQEGLPFINIFDIDGTVALNTIIDGKPNRGWYDWLRVGEDVPNKYVITLLEALRNTDVVGTMFLSGRDAVCYDTTLEWLKINAGLTTSDFLFMRSEGDQRPDDIVKYELFNQHIRDKYNVLFVVDDRRKVCRLWHAMNLPLLAVGDPDNDF